MIKTEMLRNIKLFAELSKTTLGRIADVALERTYVPDETIFIQDEVCNAAYFIIAGEVRIYRISPEGREQVLVTLVPGQAFNIVPTFLPQDRNRANAIAITDVRLYNIRKTDFLRLLRECSDLSLPILRDFAGRLSHLTDLVEDLALRSVQGRLARFLLEQVEDTTATRRWTQNEIAAHLGTVRDMIGRALRVFTNSELITIARGRIVVLNREGLQHIAET